MANWCYNVVCIEYRDSKLQEKFVHLLTSVEYDSRNTEGQRPLLKEGRFMFDMELNDAVLEFDSKWAPAITTILQYAKMFNFDFTLEYDESGSELYGEYAYNNETGVLTDKHIDEWVNESDGCSNYDEMDKILKKKTPIEVKIEDL